MEKVFSVAQVIAPIFTAIFLGMVARRKSILTPEETRGLQQFVVKFGLPCVVFNSCLTAKMGMESIGSMALVLTAVAVSAVFAFRARKKRFPYHNLPMLFSAQETGMMGIPLFMILFGAEEAYRVGVLDLTQAIVAYPVIALLTANAGENPAPGEIAKKVITSPLVVMSLSGLALNLSGIGGWLDQIGLRAVITECTGLLAQPVSVLMIFSIGYNFSLDGAHRKAIYQISAIRFGMYLIFCGIMQGALFLMPKVDPLTRWALLLYCALPTSFLAPGLGRRAEEFTVASGVCSVLTVVCLVVFCAMAVVVA